MKVMRERERDRQRVKEKERERVGALGSIHVIEISVIVSLSYCQVENQGFMQVAGVTCS